MARAIDICIVQMPAYKALGWVLAGCGALAALALYLHGAVWPASIALAVALCGLQWPGAQAPQSLHIAPDRSSPDGGSGHCELVTAQGRFLVRITSASTWGSMRLLRYHRGTAARTLLLLPGTVAAVKSCELGRWLESLRRK